LKDCDLISETPKGYWAGHGSWKYKRVKKCPKKEFAHPDKKDATTNCTNRTWPQIETLKARLEIAEIALNKAKHMEI